MMTNEDVRNEILRRVQAVEKKKTQRKYFLCATLPIVVCCFFAVAAVIHFKPHSDNLFKPDASNDAYSKVDSVPSENKYPAQATGISLFDPPKINYEYDYYYGDDGLPDVSVVLGNASRYLQLDKNEYSKYGFKTELTKSDFGEFIGTVVQTDGDSFNFEVASQNPNLAGASVYYYQPIGCKAVIIVKNDEHCSIFVFASFTGESQIRSIAECYDVFGVRSANDIACLRYRISGTVDGDYQIIENGEVTNEERIKDFYDVTVSLSPQKIENPFAPTPDWLNEAYEEYRVNPEKYKQEDIFVEIYPTNGLIISDIDYRPYIGNGYVGNMDELTPEQNAVLRSALNAE